jgi:hypothetical protein
MFFKLVKQDISDETCLTYGFLLAQTYTSIIVNACTEETVVTRTKRQPIVQESQIRIPPYGSGFEKEDI